MSTLSPSRASVRNTMAEQFAPVLRVRGEVLKECAPVVDQADARRLIASGQIGYDALRVLKSCGELNSCFARVLDAFEVSGLVSNVERRALLSSELDVDDLICGWLAGNRTPRDPQRRLARQVAIVIGNALLRRATERVGTKALWRTWTRPVCPCCGGAPDIALVERSGRGPLRTLICAHCDAQWQASREGCLGCDASETLEIARISNRALGYDLMMCNNCGRFLKERPRRGLTSLLIERALTAELDLAAEQRGLRI
ncbi:MAG: formate dehydrogenase accessory protein FdhE [bacterium]